MAGDDEDLPRVVVGIDGSIEGERALRWAVREAAALGAQLEVCSFWSLPVDVGYPSGWSYDELAAGPKEIHDEGLRLVAELDPSLPVRSRFEEGSPSPGLVDASRGALLLVVGSKGRGGFAHMLLGSVSHHCVHHALCPVLVVRPEEREIDGDARHKRARHERSHRKEQASGE